MKTLIVTLFLFCTHLFSEPQILFMSTPRSGTNYLSYCLTYLTRSRIHASNFGPPLQRRLVKELAIKKNRSFIWHTHNDLLFPKGVVFDPEQDILIALIRNPTESFFRDFLRFKERKLAESLEDICDSMSYNYIKVLSSYDKWNPKKRILIKYEDLINTTMTETILRKCLRLIDLLDERELADFIKKLKFHNEKSIEILHYTSITKGKNKSYYKELLTGKQIEIIQRSLESNCPEIFNNYLKDYF